MEKNPYLLQQMKRFKLIKNQFEIKFSNNNFPNELFTFIYRYGAGERIHFYNEDMTEVTVEVATYLRDSMNHVFNETEEA
jgi:hypothetical protein